MSFKIVLNGILLCMIILGVAAYLAYLQTGRYSLPLPNVPKISLSTNKSSANMGILKSPATTTYKWQLNGHWHYGDVPPDGADAQLVGKELP